MSKTASTAWLLWLRYSRLLMGHDVVKEAPRAHKVVLVSHLQRKIVEGGVVGASAAAETKLLLMDGLWHLHSLADCWDVTALIRSASYSSEVCGSD